MTFEIGMSIYRCGLCCNKAVACERCLHDTLKSNDVRLDTEENMARLRAAGGDSWRFECALRDMIRTAERTSDAL